MNRERRTSIKALIKLLKDGKIPWIPYLIIFAINLYMTNLSVKVYEYAGMIMGGEIFDKTIVTNYVAMSIAVACIGFFTIVTLWITINFQKRTQQKVWEKFLHLPMRRLEELEPSSLASRVTVDAGFVGSFLNYFTNIFQSGYAIYLATVVLFKNSAKLASYVVPIIIVSTLISVVFGRYIYKIYFRLQDVDSRITKFFNEKLSAIKLIKSISNEDEEIDNGIFEADVKFKAQKAKVAYDTLWTGYQSFITIVVKGIVLIMGAKLVQSGEMEVGGFVTFFMLAAVFPGKVQSIFTNALSLVRIFGQTQVVANINTEVDEKLEAECSPLNIIGQNEISFNNVSFNYDGKTVLENINFSIMPNKTTAIVGPSGAGKTTILKLIERVYDNEIGQIRLGNKNVNEYNLGEWREYIGYVIQNSPLLPGTVRDNISYGCNSYVDDKSIENVLELVELKQEVLDLPNGLDTNVGDIGDKLSSGQKQRIAIARALIKDPEVLILDEATANLDTINESKIMQNILSSRQGKTNIIVAHRLNTIKDADNIIVIDNGKVENIGSHSELIKNDKLYLELVG